MDDDDIDEDVIVILWPEYGLEMVVTEGCAVVGPIDSPLCLRVAVGDC